MKMFLFVLLIPISIYYSQIYPYKFYKKVHIQEIINADNGKVIKNQFAGLDDSVSTLFYRNYCWFAIELQNDSTDESMYDVFAYSKESCRLFKMGIKKLGSPGYRENKQFMILGDGILLNDDYEKDSIEGEIGSQRLILFDPISPKVIKEVIFGKGMIVKKKEIINDTLIFIIRPEKAIKIKGLRLSFLRDPPPKYKYEEYGKTTKILFDKDLNIIKTEEIILPPENESVK